MLENIHSRPAIIERRRSGLFGAHVDLWVTTLSQLGYTIDTLRKKVRLLRAFERWLVQRKLAIVDLDEAVFRLFLKEQRSNGLFKPGEAQTVRHFVDHLRAKGVIQSPEPTIDESPIAILGRQYENYLKKERGLSPITIAHHWQIAQRFIAEKFTDVPIHVRDLVPDDVSRFLVQHARSGSPAAATMMVTGLRSFFRFLFVTKQTDCNLSGAVPMIPRWRLADLPKYITQKEVEQVIQACEWKTRAATRDRAIVLLLARLGLRAGEVFTLELDDVNWRAGELKVRGKGGQHNCLPLPSDVGLALAEYLRHHRPTCTTRRIFVRTNAPHRGFTRSSSLGTIVRRAINRAGLKPNFKGAHVLRHSLATGMLRSGASLDEIGQVLRHRSANTTAIYAKVDVQGLRSLALPWPTKEVVQ